MIAKRKSTLLVLILPLLLCACGHEVVENSKLIKEDVTLGAQEVIYPDAAPSVPDGQVVWEKANCASCHGATGSRVIDKGTTNLTDKNYMNRQKSVEQCCHDTTSSSVTDKGTTNLTDKNYMNRQKPVEQYRLLAFGDPKLPSDHPILYKSASRREIWNLVFYVRSLSRPPMSPAKVMEVDAVFGSNCAVCHGKKGYGDGPLSHNLEPIPANFQDFKRFYDRTDATLWDHIANGIKWEGMPNFLGKEDKAKNIKFDDAYIWQLVDYVRHFHETTEKTLPADNKSAKLKT